MLSVLPSPPRWWLVKESELKELRLRLLEKYFYSFHFMHENSRLFLGFELRGTLQSFHSRNVDALIEFICEYLKKLTNKNAIPQLIPMKWTHKSCVLHDLEIGPAIPQHSNKRTRMDCPIRLLDEPFGTLLAASSPAKIKEAWRTFPFGELWASSYL